MNDARGFVEDVIEQHRGDKDGAALLDDLVKLHMRQTPDAREELVAVYRAWLHSGDPVRADWGVALVRRLGLTEELPLLERLLSDIEAGRSPLPTYFRQFLVPTIEELKKAGE